MSLASEFREFAMKGSVIDLAVGVVIGAAFGKIVDSMVNDIIMPIVGIVSGGKSFVDKFFAIDGGNYKTLEEARKAGGAVIAYGNFIQTTLNFLIIAFVLFMVIKAMNNLKRLEELKINKKLLDIE